MHYHTDQQLCIQIHKDHSEPVPSINHMIRLYSAYYLLHTGTQRDTNSSNSTYITQYTSTQPTTRCPINTNGYVNYMERGVMGAYHLQYIKGFHGDAHAP